MNVVTHGWSRFLKVMKHLRIGLAFDEMFKFRQNENVPFLWLFYGFAFFDMVELKEYFVLRPFNLFFRWCTFYDKLTQHTLEYGYFYSQDTWELQQKLKSLVAKQAPLVMEQLVQPNGDYINKVRYWR